MGIRWGRGRAIFSPRAGFRPGSAGVRPRRHVVGAVTRGTRRQRGQYRAHMGGRVPFLVALVACTGACDGPGEPARGAILITCDTLRAYRLGFMGCPRGTSPSLDALAQESLVFDTAWSTAPLTGPALAALFTGRPPEEPRPSDHPHVLAGQA